MKKMTTWQPLKAGDIVDVVAPGFSTTDEKLKGAVQFLENLGLKPRVPANLFGPDIICANTDEIRFQLLKKALQAKDSRAIWCVRGGYGAVRLMHEVAKLKKPKTNKLFIGYSDATTLHNFFNQFWNFATLHGPLLDRLGQHTLPLDQVNELVELVLGTRDEVVFKGLRPLNKVARKKTKIRGSMAGGNLKVTESHLATKFARVPKGQILFFEDIGERGYRVDRELKHLEMAGYFKGVKAIVFGDFINCEEPGGESLVPKVIERFASEQSFPVFSGLEVGHGSFQRPLPLGTLAELVCGSSGILTVQSGSSSKNGSKK
jgi:muramoyltetrapeptide carboxypeptidase